MTPPPARKTDQRRHQNQEHAKPENQPGRADIDAHPEGRGWKHLYRQRRQATDKPDPDEFVDRHFALPSFLPLALRIMSNRGAILIALGRFHEKLIGAVSNARNSFRQTQVFQRDAIFKAGSPLNHAGIT